MRLTGIELHTADVNRLAAFYALALGGKIRAEHGGPNRLEVALPDEGGAALAVCADEQAAHGAACLEFRVDDVDREYERLRQAGIHAIQPPADLPWGFRYFSVSDPDGNGVSFVAPK